MRAPIIITPLALLALVTSAACDLEVADLNNDSLDELVKNPTRTRISAASTGLLIASREDVAILNGYVSILGVLGRESYIFDPADPRGLIELLESEMLSRGSSYGGALWAVPYRNLRNCNVVLAAVDAAPDMTPAEKEATRGFAKTIAAIEYLRIINTRDDQGAVIQRSADPRVLDPLVTKAEVLAHIATLLDEARSHLMAGGMAFPFTLGSGFAGFDQPPTFLRANRALKARADLYRKDHVAALAALGESFLSDAAAAPGLQVGIFHAYGTGTGDRVNRLIEPNHFAHPSIKAGAEMQPGGMPDARVVRKLKTVMPRTSRMLTSDQAFAVYDSSRSPVPIIRNEELILLRAEARFAAGDLPGATADINFIRVQSGGLAPRMDLTMDNFVDELLKQRLYSLLFEGGHRWIDARRFGRLESLPLDRPEHHRHLAMPIPLAEADAR
jgi:starch-binding outer membrane protein, SusD/RagB family